MTVQKEELGGSKPITQKMGSIAKTNPKMNTRDSSVNLTESTELSSGANRPTIGSTTISSAQAEIIKKEVRNTIQKVFPGINLSTDRPVFPSMGSGANDIGKPDSEVIDLSGSTAHSAPLAIAGSDVSMASTLSKLGNGESNTSFSRMMLGSGTVTSA